MAKLCGGSGERAVEAEQVEAEVKPAGNDSSSDDVKKDAFPSVAETMGAFEGPMVSSEGSLLEDTLANAYVGPGMRRREKRNAIFDTKSLSADEFRFVVDDTRRYLKRCRKMLDSMEDHSRSEEDIVERGLRFLDDLDRKYPVRLEAPDFYKTRYKSYKRSKRMRRADHAEAVELLKSAQCRLAAGDGERSVIAEAIDVDAKRST